MTVEWPDAAGPEDHDLEKDFMQECMESLYQLNRTDLRRLAWEALLISDGPDKSQDLQERPEEDEPFKVIKVQTPASEAFFIKGKNGWTT
jgi:hypothetical protein